MSRKPLTKKLLQPFDAITFFYEAARITLDEFDMYLTQWKNTADRAVAHKLYGSFRILARCSVIHSEHIIDGLFPEIKELVDDRLRQRHSTDIDNAKLTSALSTMPALVAKHRENKAISERIAELIARFVSCVEKNVETEAMFESVTAAMKPWMANRREWLRSEVQFLCLWVNELANDKIDEIKLVRAIIDSNRDAIVADEFAFIVRRLSMSRSADWTCPFSGYQYSDSEVLAVYIGALQVTSTEEEYAEFLKLIPQCIASKVWEQLEPYGLHQKGTFRYSTQVARTTLTDTCAHNDSCSQMDAMCSIL